MRALVVDDDLALADVLSFTLRRAGFDVNVAHDGRAALERWQASKPDVIILDLNLPRLGGLEVCKAIRKESDIPIIILSVRADEEDIVQGLRLGADDYIVKPFSPRQLIARVEAVLRRAGAKQSGGPDQILHAGVLSLEVSRSLVKMEEKDLARLSNLECRLLQVFLLNPGQVLTMDYLIDQIWGSAGGDRTMLKQLVYRLRRKIQPAVQLGVSIEAISGVGYLLQSNR